jgi:hypothetical protein
MATTDGLYCWPIDLGCCAEFDSYPEEVQARAQALAGLTLHTLTGHRIGGCPITVRPCRQRCSGYAGSQFYWSGTASFSPLNWNGTWFNCHCGGDECSCGALCQIELPTPVGAVSEVTIDGEVLDPAAYRVDDARYLLRVDGECWPDCQDMTAAPDEVGSFTVTYLNAVPVDPIGEYVGGLLACEYAKACSGAKCRLPSGVTEITRQGISMSINRGAFPDGLTGIREVDLYVQSVNPYALKTAPAVWTPDMVKVRTTTAHPVALLPPAPTYSAEPYSTEPYVGGLAGLEIRRMTPVGNLASDDEIASIDWGDGTVDTAPYSRPGPGQVLITHSYLTVGEKVWTVTFTNERVTPASGVFNLRYSYSIDMRPWDGDVVATIEPFLLRPWDSYASAPLPTNEHFATIAWGDGVTDSNPFVLDGDGFATHIYAVEGYYTSLATTFDGTTMPTGITVEPVPPPTVVAEMPSVIDLDCNAFTEVTFEANVTANGIGVPIDARVGIGTQGINNTTVVEITEDGGTTWTPLNATFGGTNTVYVVLPVKTPTASPETLTWRVRIQPNGEVTDGATVSVSYEPRSEGVALDTLWAMGGTTSCPDYRLDWDPDSQTIFVGGTFGMRPLSGPSGPPLPPDTTFTSLDWGDGTVETPPFTIDGNGFATHVYTAVGNFDTDAFFINGKESGTLALVIEPPPPTYSVTEMPKAYPPVPYEPNGGGLLIEQVTPTPGTATDAEIASINWGDGSAPQVAPYTRNVEGYIRHSFLIHGTVNPDGSVTPLPWTVDFTDPNVASANGTFDVVIDYYIGYLPSPPNMLVGGTLAVWPRDGYQGAQLVADQHFTSIDWGDGTAVQTPPFTVDGSGHVTHVYAAAGVFNSQYTFVTGATSGLNSTVTTTVVATQEELDVLNAAKVEQRPEGVE